MNKLLAALDGLLWNGCLIYLLLGVGLYYTVRLRGMQLRFLPYALKLAFSRKTKSGTGDISQFQSLMTALAATIGIGSIAGMATAVMAGGFGAIFWMWVVALIGMVTKYAEAILAVKFRKIDAKGEMSGGPMHYIEQGLKWKWLAIAFAVFGILSAFAGGNLTQSNSIAAAMHEIFAVPPLWTGAILGLLTACVILGGIRSLGKFNAVLVPAMALLYITGGLLILFLRIDQIPASFALIFEHALRPQAAVGGFLGASVMTALQFGIVRGICSNEAGLGSAPIAAAAAKTDVPGRQALVSMTGVFLSSFVICTITVLVLCVTGVFGSLDAQGHPLNGAALVMSAFGSVLPGGAWIVAVSILLFGFSTILGWSYYGEKCLEYLTKGRWVFLFRCLFIGCVCLGSVVSLEVVWSLVDIMNGLMALPNLIALLFLSPVVVQESRTFFELVARERAVHAVR